MPRFGRPVRRVGPPLIPGRFRMPLRPLPPLPPGSLRALAQAHQLMTGGQFAQAAERFEALAVASRAAGIPRAPRLFLQAARANWHAGQVGHGMDLLHTGLDMLIAVGAVAAAGRVASLAISELKETGHPQEADQLKQYASTIPGMEESLTSFPQAGQAHPVLPTHCPQCGAAVRANDVDWIDERTAECAYCGSPIRPEKS
jgi:hypothetical protein